MTGDPVMGVGEVPLSWNRYLYGNADAVNMVDPRGTSVYFEYSLKLKSRFFSVALHPGHHYWVLLGLKVYCVHLQILTAVLGVKGSHRKVSIPLFPFCRMAPFK
jgi:hypothetical protein